MAPLYKRYIPPKASNTTTSIAAAPTLKTTPLQVPETETDSKKRKRDRPPEEVAERKAKKLRKKGIDPATVLSEPSPQVGEHASTAIEQADHASETAEEVMNGIKDDSRGDFAHVKNVKKRHKLQKEARKARTAAGKIDGRDASSRDTDSEVLPTRTAGDDHVQGGGSQDSLVGEEPQHITDKKVDPVKRKKRQRQDGTQPEAIAEAASIPDQEKKSGKKKKLKTKQQGSDETVDEPQSPHRDDQPTAGEYNVELSRAKKRRHKLEMSLQEGQDETPKPSADDGQQPEKHDSLLRKYQKSAKLSKSAAPDAEVGKEQPPLDVTMLDLAPLPQPAQSQTAEFISDSTALPSWLRNPTIVSDADKVPFSALKLEPKTVEHLSQLGFDDALPIQHALIPLLLTPGTAGARFLPGSETVLPDIAVGAPTGSGKTIAYLLPIVESMKTNSRYGGLKAVVVVPTRELVVQVAAVAESLAKGSSIKIGMAMGTSNLKDEQERLTKSVRKYQPGRHKEYSTTRLPVESKTASELADVEHVEDEVSVENEDEDEDATGIRHSPTPFCGLVDHSLVYEPTVDVLITTPGRLLEHIANTPGFTLARIEWLVLDEADKLLDQHYNGFLDLTTSELSKRHSPETTPPSAEMAPRRLKQHVRKVVLSATMTKDISKLVRLRLRRPRMIVVRGSEQQAVPVVDGGVGAEGEGTKNTKDGFELPRTLTEHCVHVGDGSEKPLYLVNALQSHILIAFTKHSLEKHQSRQSSDRASSDNDSDGSSSDSDLHSLAESSADSASDEESSDSASSDDSVDVDAQSRKGQASAEIPIHPDRAAMLDRALDRRESPSIVPNILIFTSSNESAERLAYVLGTLQPEWAPFIRTMTNKSGPKQKSHRNSKLTEPVITISTDRAARGLDAVAARPVTHVVQYDVPHSLTSYIHRVGRTARAGRYGEAWTLYTHSEGRWFLNAIIKAKNIKRPEAVRKVKLTMGGDEMREKLQDVVSAMRDEVFAQGRVR